MRLHPRTNPVDKARNELELWVINWAERHDLTFAEIRTSLTRVLGTFALHALRQERHPEEPDRKADEE